jgi:hypothetical protein
VMAPAMAALAESSGLTHARQTGRRPGVRETETGAAEEEDVATAPLYHGPYTPDTRSDAESQRRTDVLYPTGWRFESSLPHQSTLAGASAPRSGRQRFPASYTPGTRLMPAAGRAHQRPPVPAPWSRPSRRRA